MRTFKKCDICDDYYLPNKCMSKYCSIDCKNIGHSILMTGKNNPSWNNNKCIDCNKKLLKKHYIRCKQCYNKYCIKDKNPNWKGGLIILRCVYCDTEYKIKRCYINRSRFCSRICSSKYNSILDRNPNWKNGVTSSNLKIRTSEQYKQWRLNIFERDNYTCVLCNIRGGYLEVHHIKKFSKYINLRFDLNNGVSLCKICHQKTKGCEEDYEQTFKNIVSNRLCLV